ncbi:hypothetical protein BCR43DRAFT_489073 [Syncephalastrum racemosum]|uniref:Uncharacterized protein n=1 Tax=Syncephalastrum racemosum TaxID=13706 RepID=A0A1X2HJN5_SYNRA|nr:hypothetical protein BCR43DRAFT_489073 [Syncephalastrum racemosum]
MLPSRIGQERMEGLVRQVHDCRRGMNKPAYRRQTRLFYSHILAAAAGLRAGKQKKILPGLHFHPFGGDSEERW